MDDMHTFPDCPPALSPEHAAALAPALGGFPAGFPAAAPAALEAPARSDEHGGYLNGKHVEAIVRAAETALEVRRRYQFFVWTQSNLQILLPHQLLSCGAYQRQRRELHFELFNNVAVVPELQLALSDNRGPLLLHLQQRWIEHRCKPLHVDVVELLEPELEPLRLALLAGGYSSLWVHGISRPQRPAEVESFFVLAPSGSHALVEGLPLQSMLLELLTPYLHGTWQRVQTVEREIHEAPRTAAAQARQTGACGITDREREILGWLREGMSNLQIGVKLGISALTVKNHVQKILRKLNAANRAQAVARAMSMNLLGRSPSEEAAVREDD